MEERRVYIVELAEAVDRRPATIRAWERLGMLPKGLRPKRSDRGWRYWTESQVEQIKAWMKEQDLRPGKGLKHYQPDEETLKAHLAGQRRPRKDREKKEAAMAAASHS